MLRGPSIHDQAIGEGTLVFEFIDVVTGERTFEVGHNLITNTHKGRYASFLAGNAPASPDYIGLGTGALAQYAETNQDTNVPLKSTGADQKLGQEFIAAGSGTKSINSVWLWIKRIGSSSGLLYVDLQTDAAGLPSGTPVTNGTSSAVNFNTLGTSYDWVKFSFATRPSLTLGTVYHLVFYATGYTYSAAVTEAIWGVDESAPGYASGQTETYDGATWTSRSPASDTCFRVVAEPDLTYTALTDQTIRNQMTSKTIQGTTKARLLANFTAAQANDTHGEVGVFDIAAAGNLYAIAVIKTKKTSTQILNVYWVFTIS